MGLPACALAFHLQSFNSRFHGNAQLPMPLPGRFKPLPSGETTHGNLLCDPSQKQSLCECLQPHHATVFDSVISTFLGAKPVPLCEPSQNGCPLDRPHAHQK